VAAGEDEPEPVVAEARRFDPVGIRLGLLCTRVNGVAEQRSEVPVERGPAPQPI
jgi:hypothetical protein